MKTLNKDYQIKNATNVIESDTSIGFVSIDKNSDGYILSIDRVPTYSSERLTDILNKVAELLNN